LRQARRAATLLGAAEALRQAIDSSMTAREQDEYEQEISALRVQFDEIAFSQAWLEGRAMGTDEAIALALQASADPS
jgi:hypothetical protein